MWLTSAGFIWKHKAIIAGFLAFLAAFLIGLNTGKDSERAKWAARDAARIERENEAKEQRREKVNDSSAIYQAKITELNAAKDSLARALDYEGRKRCLVNDTDRMLHKTLLPSAYPNP